MQIYLALGANLGDRYQAMHDAIQALDERIGPLVKCSSFYETAPVDFESQHLFLNAAACFETQLTVDEVLKETQKIEKEMGRTQKSHGGIHYDRIIDIDLLICGNLVVHTPDLDLPHPRMTERQFVMEPMAEIAPQLLHPVKGQTMAHLYHDLCSTQ